MSRTPLASRLVVVLFTDLVGSTALKNALGADAYTKIIQRHDALFRESIGQTSGFEIQQTGDGFYACFDTCSDAVRCALLFQHAMAAESWNGARVQSRVGVHLGEVTEIREPRDGVKLIGMAVDLASRVMSLAVGGQILLTRSPFNDARQFIREYPIPSDTAPSTSSGQAPSTGSGQAALRWIAHGPYLFKGSDEAMEIFEVGGDGIAPLTPPPDGEKARRAVRLGDEQVLGWRPAIGAPMPDSPNWIIKKKVGEGGFGEVWLAEHAKTQSVRVFKFCFEIERLRALKREVALFRLLKEALGDRPDTARVIDHHFDSAPYFIEMEFAPEGNLADWAERQGGIAKIPLAERLTLVSRIAAAVAAAHSVGILHKDIKPSNVLIITRPDGTVFPRLTDFGIGALTDRSTLESHQITMAGFTASQLTNESSRAGSRMYTPPEAQSGSPFTTQGDIYAIGVLLFQIVVADLRRPLASGWERDVHDEILREDIAACVEGDLSQRLSSAGEIVRRLDTLESRRAERRCVAALRARSVRRRRNARLGAAALVIAVIIAATAIWVAARERRLRSRAVGAEKIAQAATEQAQRDEREAEIRLAEGQTAQGDALGLAGRWGDARDVYWQSYGTLKRLGLSTFNTEAGLSVAYAAASSPLRSFASRSGGIAQIAVTRDGRTVVASWHGKTESAAEGFSQWDLLTGREHRRMLSRGAEFAGSVSADGRFGLSQNLDYTLTLWDLTTQTAIRTLSGHESHVTGIAFSRDGQNAVSASRDGKLIYWSLTSGRPVRVAEASLANNGISFAPEGQSAAFAQVRVDEKNWLARWDLTTGNLVNTIALPECSGGYFVAPGSATALLAVSDPSSIFQLDLTTGKTIHVISDPGEISALTLTPDCRRCLAGERSGAIRYFDFHANAELAALSGHQGPVTSVGFLPGGQAAISGGFDGTIKLWSLHGGMDVRTITGHTQRVVSIALSRDGRTVLSGSNDRTIRLWDVATGRQLQTFVGHTDCVHSLVFAGDGRTAFSGSSDGTVRHWDIVNGTEIATVAAGLGYVWGIAMTGHDNNLIIARSTGPAKFLDLTNGRETAIDEDRNTGHPIGVAVAPDGATALLVGGVTMYFWNTQESSLLREIGDVSGAQAAVFTHDGSTALVAFGYGIRQWDVKSGNELRGFSSTGGLRCVAVSPDGRLAAAGSGDKTVKLFNRSTGQEIRSLAGHQGAVRSVAISPDGRTLVSGSEDKTVRIWDIGRVAKYPEFERRLAEAEAKLKDHPDDPAALAAIGEWYAFRGVHEWAVELLERARAGGATVDPLTLARCYWELADDLPPGSALTREECLARAHREFSGALSASHDEQEKFYLQLCIGAVEREAASPATQPATAPSTRSSE